jgi:hypothetical protein
MQQQKRLKEGRLVVVPLRGRKCGRNQVFLVEGKKEYKILHEEERKGKQ